MSLETLFMSAYFYGRQRIPLFFYLLTAYAKDKPRIRNKVVNPVLLIVSLLTVYSVGGFLINSIRGGLPFNELFPIRWRYSGAVTWGIFALVFYIWATKICETRIEAVNLACLAVFAGGWLYEVPYFHPYSMFFSSNAVLYLNGQIVSLILLLYELGKRGCRPRGETLAALLVYVGFSVFISSIPRIYIHYEWFHRVPSCLLFLALVKNTPPFEGLRERNLESWFEELEIMERAHILRRLRDFV